MQCSERHGVFSDLEKICTSYVIWKPNVKSQKKKVNVTAKKNYVTVMT